MIGMRMRAWACSWHQSSEEKAEAQRIRKETRGVLRLEEMPSDQARAAGEILGDGKEKRGKTGDRMSEQESYSVRQKEERRNEAKRGQHHRQGQTNTQRLQQKGLEQKPGREEKETEAGRQQHLH